MQCFCENSRKGKIKVNFSDGKTENFTSNNTPVCIEVKPLQTTITYSSNWEHGINHLEQFDTVDGIVTWDGNCTNANSNNCYAVLSNGFTPYYIGNNSCGLSIVRTPPRAMLTDSTGHSLIIFGETPITFEGLCGDDCPDGYVKCHSDSYPGYCCLPCSDVENRINALTQLAKNIVG